MASISTVDVSVSDDPITWNFTYNADGLRTKRTDGTTTYSYAYNGSQLTAMTVGTNTLYFSYDAAGTPMSVKYGNEEYFYTSNIQGDVTGIVNSSGATVVTYGYDAWGNILSVSGSDAATLGTMNPLRYRGYIYDQETGLYYLQSRYYNPAIGRFINGDGLVSTGQGFVGNNMFAYCGNNPITGYDPFGYWDWGWKEAVALGTTLLIGGAALLLAVPTGGGSLVLGGGLVLSAGTATAAGGAAMLTGTVILGDGLCRATTTQAKKSKKSGKEKANDKPSYVSRSDVDPNKSSKENTKDILNRQFGPGNWKEGPGSDYSKIKKWIERGIYGLFMEFFIDQEE